MEFLYRTGNEGLIHTRETHRFAQHPGWNNNYDRYSRFNDQEVKNKAEAKNQFERDEFEMIEDTV